MRKLCFSTIVFGWYQDFIPLYIYSILSNFPQHHVKIFLLETLTPTNRQHLDMIPNSNWEIIENFRPANTSPKSARYFLGPEYFSDFDYIYIGDIDIMIFNEFNQKNFYEFYLDKCEKTNLPFSNSWYFDSNIGRYRMSGLHFIIKDPYFNQMSVMLSKSYFSSNEYSFDEQLLFSMLSQIFDLRNIGINRYQRPLHGFHFGPFRTHPSPSVIEISTTHDINMRNLLKTDFFKQCYSTLCPEIKELVSQIRLELIGRPF